LPQPENALAEFVTQLQPAHVPVQTRKTAQRVLLACAGTGVAAAGEAGIAEIYALLRRRGGAEQARVLVFGGRLPAHAAAQFNGTLCRALDYCDALEPGSHNGSSVMPAAFAAAELVGGCSGEELLAGIVIGCEIGARMRLTEAMYDGYDPTGISVVFGATAAAARILRLSTQQTLHALALAFNRCAGSFQSNIDGSLAVRVIQGWVAQTGIECAELAYAGITGPDRFLTGIYGFAQLYGRGELDPESVTNSIGHEWRMDKITFKKYPSCGATQGMTELSLGLVEELNLSVDDVARVEVRINPYCDRLVGGEFTPGQNIRVDAQFSAQYCIANAIVHKASTLTRFTPDAVADERVRELIGRIRCVGDPALDTRNHSAVELDLTTKDGHTHFRSLDASPGFPGNELSDAEHTQRFEDCMKYAAYPLSGDQIAAFRARLDNIEQLADARALVDCLILEQQ
jgi:2-methylcitrate dehydratase PrpD